MEEEQQRDFSGIIIPKEIWLNEDLTMLEKGILAEVASLDNKDGCYASNARLAEFCKCSETKISKAISKLVKLGFLTLESFDGRKRVLHKGFAYFTMLTSTKDKADLQKVQGANYNNNLDNNLDNIKKENIKRKKASATTRFKSLLDELFDKTYEIYPRKIARGRARKVWYSKFTDCEDEEQVTKRARKICKMVMLCKAKWDDQNRDEEFMPYFSTWLNDSVEIK